MRDPVLPAPDVRLPLSLYVLEASALLVLVASYEIPPWRRLAFLPSLPGVVFLVACLALLSAAAVVVHRYRMRAGHEPRRFAFTVVLNLVPVLLLIATGELAVRLLSRPTPRGLVFMDTVLLPHRWSDIVARNEAILARSPAVSSYVVPDELLGWVVGPNRRSADGLYASSVAGIRSSRSGVALGERLGRHRVALVGDSFRFGLDVS